MLSIRENVILKEGLSCHSNNGKYLSWFGKLTFCLNSWLCLNRMWFPETQRNSCPLSCVIAEMLNHNHVV